MIEETEYYFKEAALNAVGQGPYGEAVMAPALRAGGKATLRKGKKHK